MTTLQEYLNNEYPTKKEREKVKEIRINKINEKRGDLELLEGGELDLRDYVSVDWISLDGDLLKTPFTNINLEGLDKAKGYCFFPNNSLGFSGIKTLWDYKYLLKYNRGIYKKFGFSSFALIKEKELEKLTSLAYQLNKNNWQDPSFISCFGVDKNALEYLQEEQKEEPELVTVLLDNLSNQILAHCIILSNRLSHGINKEEEEKIMELALSYQECQELEKYLKETDQNKIKELVDKVLTGDKELLSRLQNLPWEVFKLEEQFENPALAETKIEILPKQD